LSKNKKWQKTLNELQISDNERQSVKNIMSRLRGNSQTEVKPTEVETNIPLPDHRSQITIDLPNDQARDQVDQNDQPIKEVFTPILPSCKDGVPIEPRSENAVPIEPHSNRTPSLQTPTIFHEARGYKSLNILDDEIMPTLAAYEQIVLRRLYRLSYGFNRQITDSVTISTLADRCNLSESTVKRSLKILIERKLVQVQINKTGEHFGNRYIVLAEFSQTPVLIEPRSNGTGLQQTSIIDDDDPLKKHDHHQGQTARVTEHQKQVMMIYENITGNCWNKADSFNYQKIKNVPVEKIEIAIKLANDRATNRPNSFAFFIKEIIASVNPKPQSRATKKKAMQKVVERVRNASVGSNISPSEFVYKVKEVCLRQDVAFDNDLLEELLKK